MASHTVDPFCRSSRHGNNKRRKRLSSSSSRWDKDSSQIVIVGAGLAGLTAALSLEQAGFTNIRLYERDASPCSSSSKRGYGLTLSYNPKGPLKKLNILELVAQQDCPSRAHYVFSPDGSVLGYFGHAFYQKQSKSWGHRQRGNLRIPRHKLLQILLGQAKSPVFWNKRLLSMRLVEHNVNLPSEDSSTASTNKEQKIVLEFEDGTTVHNVDLLVAADGIRSRVVASILPGPDLRYMGVVLILGIADYCHTFLDERGFYTLDGHHRLFTMPYQGSRLDRDVKRQVMWQLSFRLDDFAKAQQFAEKGHATLRDEVLRRCKNWHQPVIDMIHATHSDTIWGT